MDARFDYMGNAFAGRFVKHLWAAGASTYNRINVIAGQVGGDYTPGQGR